MTKDVDREYILNRDNYQCVYCGSKDDLQVDHKIPRKYGGNDSIKNLVTSCRKCNLEKSAKLSDDLKEQVVYMSKWEGGHFFNDLTRSIRDEWFSLEREISNKKNSVLELDRADLHALVYDCGLVEKVLSELLALAKNEKYPTELRANIYMWLIEMITNVEAEQNRCTKMMSNKNE